MTDSAVTQAYVNIVTGLAAGFLSLWFAYIWQKQFARVFLCAGVTVLCWFAAGAYWYVVFVDPDASIALLRRVISAWHLLAITTLVYARLFETTRQDYQAKEEVDRLKEQMLTRLQAEDSLKTALQHCQDKLHRQQIVLDDLKLDLVKASLSKENNV